MKKTLIALTVTATFSLSAFAAPVQVDRELANSYTDQLIETQMTQIDASVLAQLNAQSSDVAVIDDVVYEKQSDGTWAAVGAASAALVAGLLSTSSSSDNSVTPELPIQGSPDHLPQVDGGDNGWDNLPPGHGENPMLPFTHNGEDFVLDTTTGLVTKDGVVVASVERDGYITATVTDHASGNTYKIWKDANGLNIDWSGSEVDNDFGGAKPGPEQPPKWDGDHGWDNLAPGHGENPMLPFTHNGIDFVLDTSNGLITKDGVVVASVERDGYITGTVTDHASGNTYKIWKDANGINVDWVNSEIDNGFEVSKPAPELPSPEVDNPIHDTPDWEYDERTDGSYEIYRDGVSVGNVKHDNDSENGRTNLTVVTGNQGGVVIIETDTTGNARELVGVTANDQAKETIKSIAKQPRFDKVRSQVQSRIN